MVVAALVVSIAAMLLSGLVALAVVELVASRSAGQLSAADDVIEDLELAPDVEGTLASAHGLPAEIDSSPAHLVLVISPMCMTCHALAVSFDGVIPEHVTVVVTASDPSRMRAWADRAGLHAGDVVFDDDMEIANSLRVASSPTGIGFAKGLVAFAVNVAGRDALDSLLAQRVAAVGISGDPLNGGQVPGSTGADGASHPKGTRADA